MENGFGTFEAHINKLILEVSTQVEYDKWLQNLNDCDHDGCTENLF